MTISRTEHQFQFGNCAYVAIAEAFGMTTRQVSSLFRLIKQHDEGGVTFYACKRVINVLGVANDCSISYVANKGERSYKDIVALSRNSKMIVNLDSHLSYVKDEVIYDDFIDEISKSMRDWYLSSKRQLCGWWVIRPSLRLISADEPAWRLGTYTLSA